MYYILGFQKKKILTSLAYFLQRRGAFKRHTYYSVLYYYWYTSQNFFFFLFYQSMNQSFVVISVVVHVHVPVAQKSRDAE